MTHSHPEPVRLREGPRRRTILLALTTIVVIAAGITVGVLSGGIPNPLAKSTKVEAAPSTEKTPTVKVVRPKGEASVPILVDQIATVEPYYRADLRARASGIVKVVLRDIGEKVKAGEVLAVIDVPESDQDVAKAEAMIQLRQQELKVSEAKLNDAKAAKQVSAATIKQREADVQAVSATRDLKKGRFERFKELGKRGSVVGNAVFEEERDYLASEASVTAAEANVERARADYAESESKIEAALADIELKRSQIEVARKDLDRAKTIADYGKVIAPFDGVVVRRAVDPGSFVQNATTGSSEALISIAKVDLVTVSARFPDAIATSVTNKMPALITIDELPGVSITVDVTRFAPSVQNADRTMRVEVDLFNGDDEDYQRLTTSFHPGSPARPTKGASDPLPVRAFPPDAPKTRRLIPGMTGTMRLTTGGFGNSFVLPSTAVYTRSGTSYILLVHEGKTKQVPVRVQVDDGKTVRLAVLEKRVSTEGSSREVLSELTGDELVVVARQLEVGDGVAVKSALSEW